MSGNENLCLRIPVSLGDCGDGGGSITKECCESIQASLETIIERLTKIQECVCDCGGGVIPDPGYSGEAIGVILPESGTKDDKSLYRVDKNIENVASVPADYFNKHPLWSGIVQEEIDGQVMIKIPAFAYKRGVADSGPNAGKKYLILAPADTVEPGFERHPAFMKDGQPIGQFWIGKYEAGVDPADSSKISSVPGIMTLVSTTYADFVTKAKNRNVGAVSGFMLQSVYQRAAIQMLYLVEYADVDSQKVIGSVNGSGVLAGVDAPVVVTSNYRGIVALWGNAWEFMDGIRVDVSKKLEIWKRDGSTGYVSTSFAPPAGSGAYMMSMESGSASGYDFNDMFIANQVSSSAAASQYADGYWEPSAGYWGLIGGSYQQNSSNGIFSFCLSISTGAIKGVNVGGRIAKI